MSDGTKQLTWTKNAEFLWNPYSAISMEMFCIIRENCNRYIYLPRFFIASRLSINGHQWMVLFKYWIKSTGISAIETEEDYKRSCPCYMSRRKNENTPHSCGTNSGHKLRLSSELSFVFRVLSLCSPSVCQSRACQQDNLWSFYTKITKFGPEVQSNLVVDILTKSPHSFLTICMYNFSQLTHWGWKIADLSLTTYSNA